MEKEGRRNDMPAYTRGEELFNMISHIVGGGLGVVALLACVIIAAYHQNVWGIVSGMVYGFSVILLFTMSSLYHGLRMGLPKRVFRVLDHCAIPVLIAGTYTPMLLTRFREAYPEHAWMLFGVVWALALAGIVLNVVNLRKFIVLSVVCYLGMGWMLMFNIGQLVGVLGLAFFVMLLIGGILYTVGVLFYALGKRVRYMHSVFHVFVIAASAMHSVAIAMYAMPA
ncbi:MAG: hemolysin III family protein [Defluviitaleaceae bacterium]|nr:hemolysin III family protein [Defluviitaleaceae bacterium]